LNEAERLVCFCIDKERGALFHICRLDALHPSKDDEKEAKEILTQMSEEEVERFGSDFGVKPGLSVRDTIKELLENLNAMETLLGKRYYCGGRPNSTDIFLDEKEFVDLLLMPLRWGISYARAIKQILQERKEKMEKTQTTT